MTGRSALPEVAATPWSGDALVLPGGLVLLSRDAAALALFLLSAYVTMTSGRDGLRPGAGLSPAMRELRDALDAATRASAMSGVGHADVRKSSSLGVSGNAVRADDLIDVKEVARMLQLSERQVRRLASGETFGPVKRVARSILVPRAEVEAVRANRARGER